jgi:hypothetical protein
MLPMTVSYVCSIWRELALRTPSLWRRISLSPAEDMWRERIHRAMSCSLDIELLPFIPGRLGRPQRLDLHTVQWYMHLVAPFITRWRSLKIVFSDYSPFLWNAALSCCCGSGIYAPLVRDLTLIFPSNDDTKHFTLFGGVAPRLRRLTLDGLRLTWLPSLFANLTTLDYTHHGFTHGNQAVYDVLSILEVSNNLAELRLSFPWKGDVVSGPIQAGRPVSLPVLTTLCLRVNSHNIPIELSCLVANITTPAISSLRLLDPSHSTRPFPHLHLFLQAFRIPSSLRSLHIENGWFDPRIVVPPNLHRYVVRRSHMPDRVVDLKSSRYHDREASEFTRSSR